VPKLRQTERARADKSAGMTAYSRPKEKEFSRETQYGYEAVKPARFVGTGYFDQVPQVISRGLSSTTALAESTEAEQFAAKKPSLRPQHGLEAACQPIVGDCPHTPIKIDHGP